MKLLGFRHKYFINDKYFCSNYLLHNNPRKVKSKKLFLKGQISVINRKGVKDTFPDVEFLDILNLKVVFLIY